MRYALVAVLGKYVRVRFCDDEYGVCLPCDCHGKVRLLACCFMVIVVCISLWLSWEGSLWLSRESAFACVLFHDDCGVGIIAAVMGGYVCLRFVSR